MGIGKKIFSIGSIAASGLKEKIKCQCLEKKIKVIDKKLENMNDKTGAHLIIKKENIENKIKKEKVQEKVRREKVKCKLKLQVDDSMQKRKHEIRDLNLLEKLTKEFKEIPITTAADDFAEGIADIEKAEKLILENPNDINSWLNLAETLSFYKKAFIVINGIKAPFDLIGTTLDLSTEFVGGAIESSLDPNKWTYERALKKAISLGATEKDMKIFKENFKKNLFISSVKGTGHMVYKQSKKVVKTSERLIDFAVKKFVINDIKKD